LSSLGSAPLPADAVYFGEISLSGTVRPVTQSGARLKEAERLGFSRAVIPDIPGLDAGTGAGLCVECFARLDKFVEKTFGGAPSISRKLRRAESERARARSEM
jgi:DNA repair protein RadA/Sms